MKKLYALFVALFLFSACTSPNNIVKERDTKIKWTSEEPAEVKAEETKKIENEKEEPKTESEDKVSEPKSDIVYITKSGKKYHKADCHSLNTSKIEINLSSAVKKGLTPCAKCKP